MRLAISSIVFVAAVVLVGCEKKVEAPAVADAALPEKPVASAPADPAPVVDTDAAVPVAPLTAPECCKSTAAPAPVAVPSGAPAVPAAVPAKAPVAAPTTTVTK